MTSIKLDKFAASDALISNSPAEAQSHIKAVLSDATPRSEMLDFISAQNAVNLSIVSALVAMAEDDPRNIKAALQDLVEAVQKSSDRSMGAFNRLLVIDGPDEEDTNGLDGGKAK